MEGSSILLNGAGAGLSATLVVIFLLSCFPLVISTLVGLVCAVLQSATQIQEQTLTFVPKVVTIALFIFFAGNWIISLIRDLFLNAIEKIPQLTVV